MWKSAMQFFRIASWDWTGISLKVRRMGKRFANWNKNYIWWWKCLLLTAWSDASPTISFLFQSRKSPWELAFLLTQFTFHFWFQNLTSSLNLMVSAPSWSVLPLVKALGTGIANKEGTIEDLTHQDYMQKSVKIFLFAMGLRKVI